MFLQVARVSILRAEQENGYVDGASLLGPAARVGKISPCACAFLDESPAWGLRKSLFNGPHLRATARFSSHFAEVVN
jgi:hypothetical protein